MRLTVGGHTIEVGNADKVFYPDAGITKRDVVAYYEQVAAVMLPHVRDRPVSMQRFPDGITGEGFFQKDAPDYFPDWIATVAVETESGRTVRHPLIQDAATLVYLADQACLTPHIWLSRAEHLHHPDRLIFDLDPPDADFALVRHAAHAVRALLGDLGLPAYLMTTGSRGLHVVTPLDRRADFDTVRAFARRAAELLARREPDRLTTETRLDRRGGRLFLDYLRNAYAQTSVAPYALRAKPGAPVATPLEWSELDAKDMTARRYTLRNLFRRLGQRTDPWAGIDRHARSLAEAATRLEALEETERGRS